MNCQEILDSCMVEHEYGKKVTLREYFKLLLTTMWSEGEGFSGKRPFGNSGWDLDVLSGLGRLGVIEAEFDSNGYLDSVDEKAGNRLVFELIDGVFK